VNQPLLDRANDRPQSHPSRKSGPIESMFSQAQRSALAPAVGRSRMPELDALRGVAVLAVILYHLFSFGPRASGPAMRVVDILFRPGWLGVDLFFVLSGFLITGILLDTHFDAGYFRRFYVRRVFRILPMCTASVFVGWIVLAATGEPGAGKSAVLSLIFLGNLGSLLGFTLVGTFGVYWSLAVEEHFYFLWPFLCRRLSSSALVRTLIAAIALEPLARLACARYGNLESVYYLTIYRLDGLALGALLAVFVRWPKATVARGTILATFLIVSGATITLLLISFRCFSRRSSLGASLQFTGLDILIAGLFLLVLILGRNLRERHGLLRPLGFLGDISYFAYLNHLLFVRVFDHLWGIENNEISAGWIALLRGVTILCAIMIVGKASRSIFELPLIRIGARLSAGECRGDTARTT
jgi:peptidoglycan/LPS O-acetylase OafA/YrhL